MSLWTDLLAEIYTLTTRDDLAAESAIALRQAIRMAHKSGKFWRDIVETTLTATDPSAQVQQFDLPTVAPSFRSVILLRSVNYDPLEFKPETMDNLIDGDGYYRTNVYWGMGTRLNIRAANPEETYTLNYHQYPNLAVPDNYSDWLADEHRDLLVINAALTVLNIIGEQEIRARLEPLAAIEMAELQRSNLEMVGR